MDDTTAPNLATTLELYEDGAAGVPVGWAALAHDFRELAARAAFVSQAQKLLDRADDCARRAGIRIDLAVTITIQLGSR